MQEFAVVGIVVLVVAARMVAGTWLHPSVLYGGAWLVFLSASTFLGNLHPAPFASALILASVAGATLAAVTHVAPKEVTPSRIVASRTVRRLVAFGSLAAALSGLVTQRANGLPLSLTWNLDALLANARAVTALRYEGDVATPLIGTALLALGYAAALAAPYAAAEMTGWRGRLMLVGPSSGAGFYALATTAKAPFVIAVCFTAGSWLTVHAVRAGGRPRLRRRPVLGGLLTVAVVVFAFGYFTAARLGGWTPSTERLVETKLAIYSGGGFPAFDAWISDGGAEGFQGGAQTFAGIAQFLLLDQSLGTHYDQTVSVAPGEASNVYSALRPLVEDFGVAGALLVLVLGALAAALAYRRAVARRSVGASVFVAVWLGAVFFASATSVFSFANVVIGLLVAAVVLTRHVRFADPAEPEPLPAPRAASRSRRRARRPVGTGRR